jgi:hypothetical protein
MFKATFAKGRDLFDRSVSRCASVIENQTGKVVGTVGAGVATLGASSANATGVDLTSLTSAVDFSTVIPALLLVAAALAAVYVAWKGAKMVLAALQGR